MLREREALQRQGRAEQAANHNHWLCTQIHGCTLSQGQLFLAVPSLAVCMAQHLHRMGQAGRITVESPGPTSLLKQGRPRGLLRPCLIAVSHTVKWHLLLHADLLAATGRNLQLLGEDEFHNAATSD